MKVFRTLLSVIVLASSGMIANDVVAQKDLGVFNTLGVGVSAGLTGVGVDVATSITPHFALRGGVSFMPGFNIKTDVDVDVDTPQGTEYTSLDVNGSLKRVTGELLVNYYPFNKSGFFLAAGAYFGGAHLLKISGHSEELKDLMAEAKGAGIVVGDYTIPVDEDGNVSGGLKVAAFRPYLGLGFGRAVPKKRIGVMFELGVQFHGTPKVYTDYGDLGDAFEEGDDSFSDIIEKVKVYPVMKLRLSGRIF